MTRRPSLIAICLLALITIASGQTGSNENAADRTLKGSGRVNASTLAMEFSLPLGNYPGRGINVPISLGYSSKLWRMQYTGNNPTPGGNYSSCNPHYAPMFSENSASGWTTSMAVPYIEYIGADSFYNYDGTSVSYGDVECPTSSGGSGSYPFQYIRRILVHLPSGETHELRPDDTSISFANSGTPTEGPQNAANWNATYYAVDSSNLRYVQNSSTSTYRLLMPDGSFYDFDSGATHPIDRKATTFTDRNGNYTTYNAPNSTYPNGYWTDTLGRTIGVPFGLAAPGSPTDPEEPQEYSMPGLGETYKFHWRLLKGDTEAESGLTTFSDSLRHVGDTYVCGDPATYCTYSSGTFLFGGGENGRVLGTAYFNPVVLTEIELPTGESYRFTYDVYGRIEQIFYPTGGKEKFTYSVVPTLSMLELTDISGAANFGVTNRKVYETDTDATPYEWTYFADYAAPHGYVIGTTNPDGTSSERYLHRGIDAGSGEGTFGYDNPLAGMPYEEVSFDDEGVPVSRKLTHWTYSQLNVTPNITAKAGWHPRVEYEKSFVYDSTGDAVAGTSTFAYEGNLSLRDAPVLVNKTTQYAFEGIEGSSNRSPFDPEDDPEPDPTPIPTPSPSSSPVRIVETTYLLSDSNYSGVASNYLAQNMVGLVTVSKIKNGAGTVVSQTETKYDDSTNYALITPGTPSGQWANPGHNYRGNPNTVKVWDSNKGTDPANSSYYIATNAQFDTFGNQRKVWDALENYSTTDFDTTYYAYPVQVTSPVPDSAGNNGSTSAFVTTATFDTTTGLPLTTTDANGLETRITYDEDTLRPLNVKMYYSSTQVGGTSETVYHDEADNYWVKNRSQIDADHWAESITYFDGLGRAWKSEEVNSEGNIFVEKEFDSEGRVSRVTNPFRSGETKKWTTNVYDEASRVIEVDLPDGSDINTDYGVSVSAPVGITKQITDQAGKKRLGITDALGRMIRVVEDPASSALVTDYVFDTLGNLRKTTQGDQNRYFNHSSIGRLLYAKQPEQDTNTNFSKTDEVTGNTAWSVKYEYDDNGNITKTTDAKNSYVEGTYDNLNRIKVRDYSESATPDVTFYYDGKYYDDEDELQTATGAVKGKTTGIKSSVSKTNFPTFDVFGRPTSHQQITDGTVYDTAYEYNLSGAMIEETYPSTRKVKYTLDQDGDLAQVQSKKTSNHGYWTYAGSFSYDTAGNMKKMQLGNGLWETAQYNDRLQVKEIGLGTTNNVTDLLKLEYKYDTTGTSYDNNGSLREQKITVPGITDPFIQTYTYDNLNRLESAAETNNSSQTWKQTFTIDRYGNRKFNTTGSNTTTLGTCSTEICNPEASTSRNRYSSTDGYEYDANGSLIENAKGERFTYDMDSSMNRTAARPQMRPITTMAMAGGSRK